MSPQPHPLAGLTVIWWVPLIIAIIALGAAALGELRQWFRESRELDRVQKLAALDNARGTPVRRDDCDGLPRRQRYCEWCVPDERRAPYPAWWDKPCNCDIKCRNPYCLAGEGVTG